MPAHRLGRCAGRGRGHAGGPARVSDGLTLCSLGAGFFLVLGGFLTIVRPTLARVLGGQGGVSLLPSDQAVLVAVEAGEAAVRVRKGFGPIDLAVRVRVEL